MCAHRSPSSSFRTRWLVASALVLGGSFARAADVGPADALVLVHHSRGPRWDTEAGFRDQLRIRDHVAYYEALANEGRLVMGGPFLDGSGGMMVLRAWGTVDAVRELALGDPAVEAGVLGVRVVPIVQPLIALDPARADAPKPDVRILAWLSPAGGWEMGVPVGEQPRMDAHAAFCRRQIDAGRIALAADTGDDDALVVFMPGHTVDSATELLATDPAIEGQVVQATLTEWLIVLQPPPGPDE